MAKKFKKIKEKLKDFLKKNELLYKIFFSVWGIWWIIRAKLIFRKIRHNPKKGDPKVLILAIRTIPTTNLVYFDAIFGHAFKKLGCDVKMLYCDGVLDSCDANTVFRNQRPQCFLCKTFNPFLKKSLNLDCLSYRQYISEADIEEIKKKIDGLNIQELLNYQYLGVNVSIHAKASTIRFFLSGQLDLNDPQQLEMLKRKLVYAMITVKVANEIFLKEIPTIIFMLHGIYSTWGPFVDYFRNKNIDVIIYGNMPLRFGTFLFNRNGREYELMNEKTWNNFKQIPLSDNEESQLDYYLSARFKGAVGDQLMYKKNFTLISKKQSLLRFLFNKRYSRRYILYPNLTWDACVEGRGSTIFKDIFSWIGTTIEYFQKRREYQLVIKPHPAELIWEKGTKSITDYISEKYPNLPENIVVLKPDTPLKAYDLITPDAIYLTFNGTIGLELATQGVPVLVVGNSHYKDAGVVYKVNTLKEYLSLLDDPQELISFAKTNIKLAKKYAYFYFFKSMIQIPFYRKDKWSTIDWRVVANTDKLLDENSNIIKICQKIMKREDVVVPL